MTTWTFDAIRELVAADTHFPWIEPGSPDEAAFAGSTGVVIARCHHFSPALARAVDILVYSYRDLRTVAVSAHRKSGATGSREELETWVAAQRLWLAHADLVLRYEDVEADPRAALRRIAATLADRGVPVSHEPEQAILGRIDAALARCGPSAGEWLPEEERAIHRRVEDEFKGWLQAHGYIKGERGAMPAPEGDPLEAYLAALVRHNAAKQLEVDRLVEQAAAREAARMDAESRLRAAANHLEAKQAVIDELKLAVAAYRLSFVLLRPILVPATRLAVVLKPVFMRAYSVFHRLTAVLRPKLGILIQHAPRPLCIATPTVPVPDPAPRISIVTPSYGQARFIERTIRSVIDQDYPNLEYFVQDGGSVDGTVEILQRHAARLTGWESKKDTGQSQAINRAFARTTGEIMAWLNSDDVLFPGSLAQVADFFARNPDVDVVYGHRVLIDEEDAEIGRWLMPSHDAAVLSWADFIPQETLFWRRRIWDKVGGRIDESFRFAMDWDLLLRFRDAGARFARMPRFLGAFRVHSLQKTTAGISETGFAEMDRLRERTLGRVPSRMEINRAVVPYLMKHTAAHLGWRIRLSLGLQQ
jgi:hypothetical protein